jgi:hypothetical protein
MRVLFRFSATFSTLLLLAPTVAEAAADSATAQSTKPTLCTYRDANYGLKAVICVARNYAQECDDKGSWGKPSTEPACAEAQIPVPGIPPAQCLYHDVKYGPNAVICVAPKFGQTCGDNGTWSPVTSGKDFAEACKNAQIPAPLNPTAPASSSK